MGQWIKALDGPTNLSRDIAKLSGQDVRDDIARREAQAQAEQTRLAAEQSARATQEAAAQANRQLELQAARAQAEAAAADAAGKPLENADVLLDKPGVNSVATTRRRKAQFGTGYSAGVRI